LYDYREIRLTKIYIFFVVLILDINNVWFTNNK